VKLPEAFSERMRLRLGAEWEAFVQALSQSPRTTIRLHPEKGRGLYPEALPVPWHPRGRVLTERPDFAREAPWHAGAYYVQEASSMSIRVFLPERRPLRIIDLSAAPGGKSTLLLDEIGLTGGLLIANDPDSRRRAALAENLARWAIPAYLITGRDPAWWAERYPHSFDVVLLDAPCSGEGLWRKNPSLAQTWHPEEVHFCSRRQRRLLAAAQKLVAPGGHLIYSTCTFAPEENEDNLAALFAHDPAWKPLRWENPPPEIIEISYAPRGWGYYFYPHRTIGEGFFLSAWQKEPTPTSPNKPKPPPTLRPIKPPPLPLHGPFLFFQQGETIMTLTEAAYQLLPPHLPKIEAFPIWQYHKPSHAAALLPFLQENSVPNYELNETEFQAYLRRQPISTGLSEPYVRVLRLGFPIGWLYKGRPSLPKPYLTL